tara:strand:+ start:860 stop:1096 length:237 start_codon:yes stop_codon:yes gene_type:complete
MQVTYSRTATKDLRKMPAKDRTALMDKLDTYAATGAGDVKALQGRAGFRLRHGQWRAIFDINGDIVVVRIAHRREVYK